MTEHDTDPNEKPTSCSVGFTYFIVSLIPFSRIIPILPAFGVMLQSYVTCTQVEQLR